MFGKDGISQSEHRPTKSQQQIRGATMCLGHIFLPPHNTWRNWSLRPLTMVSYGKRFKVVHAVQFGCTGTVQALLGRSSFQKFAPKISYLDLNSLPRTGGPSV